MCVLKYTSQIVYTEMHHFPVVEKKTGSLKNIRTVQKKYHAELSVNVSQLRGEWNVLELFLRPPFSSKTFTSILLMMPLFVLCLSSLDMKV